MESELKTNFDVIVLGTGFIESLIAAATARIGKKVLHLDRNGFYGDQWASFSLSGLQDWTDELNESKVQKAKDIPETYSLKEGESLCALPLSNSLFYKKKHQWHILESTDDNVESKPNDTLSNEPGVPGEESSSDSAKEVQSNIKKPKTWSKKELEKLNRKFNIDLAPKILFSRGALVELLISSNVARYVEFKCITRVLTWVNEEEEESKSSLAGKLMNVPCSRSDVFTTDVISLVEKRLLMKFLEFCYNYDQKRTEWDEYAEKPFREFLLSRHLTPKLIHFITSAIGMVDEEADCTEGLRKTSLFLNSLGRYGTMPFLFTLYGSGEMPQAFCRLCAVFEGIYILRRGVEHLLLNEEGSCIGIVSEGQKFYGDCVIMNVGYAPTSVRNNMKKKQSVSRGIFVTNQSIMPDSSDHLTILRMLPTDKDHTAVTVIELESGCAVCPKETYLVHLICGGENAETDLETTSKQLFNFGEENEEGKPNVLFSSCFNQVNYDLDNSSFEGLAPNVHLSGGPDASLDYDDAIQQAKKIFERRFPGEDFLPRAPDYNDIVFEKSNNNPDDVEPNDKATGQEELLQESEPEADLVKPDD